MLQQKKTQIKKWLSLKSIGLGESDLNISSRVISLVDNDLETDGKHIFQVAK